MDFDIPQDIQEYLDELDASSSARSSRWRSRTTTSASSTTGASTRAPTGTRAACRARSGRSCWPRRAGAPTPPATCATPGRSTGAARAAPTSPWRSSASTSRPRAWACTTTCRPSTRSSATTPSSSCSRSSRPTSSTSATRRCCRPGEIRTGFGLTEPYHGSDATHMETSAVRQERNGQKGWLINGEKMWTTGMHVANYIMCFCRTEGQDGDGDGLTVFLVPASDPGVKIEEYLWTFNMPTDHPRVSHQGRLGLGRRHVGHRGPGFAARPELRAPEPHPPGRLVAGRGGLLHPGEREVRPRPPAFRQAAQRQPGDPVAADRAAHPVRDAAPA